MTFFGGKSFGGKKQGASPARRKTESRRASVAVANNSSLAVKKKKAERKPLPWRSWGLQSMPVLAVTLVAGLLIGGWTLLDYVGSVPVSRVAVTGSLRHLDRNLLIERVRPHLNGAGFMTVDLDGIRADVMRVPWVADVSIQRRWPDQLVIAVIEQEAIARWGNDGLLNRRGVIFRPKSLVDAGDKALGDVAQLPLLYGPDNLSSEVVERYAELRELLSEQKLALVNLGSDERGSWSATLQNGVVLRLGTGDILKKMRCFSRVYQADLSAQMDRIAYIDLRYGNGVAVGWKNGDAQAATAHFNNEMHLGVNGHG
ncbi:MAG TPA: cell division protein FtsQ/DivIB [Spongiibacteraceae bacterium]